MSSKAPETRRTSDTPVVTVNNVPATDINLKAAVRNSDKVVVRVRENEDLLCNRVATAIDFNDGGIEDIVTRISVLSHADIALIKDKVHQTARVESNHIGAKLEGLFKLVIDVAKVTLSHGLNITALENICNTLSVELASKVSETNINLQKIVIEVEEQNKIVLFFLKVSATKIEESKEGSALGAVAHRGSSQYHYEALSCGLVLLNVDDRFIEALDSFSDILTVIMQNQNSYYNSVTQKKSEAKRVWKQLIRPTAPPSEPPATNGQSEAS